MDIALVADDRQIVLIQQERLEHFGVRMRRRREQPLVDKLLGGRRDVQAQAEELPFLLVTTPKYA